MDLCLLPASELTRMLAARELSSRELIGAYNDRMARLNPALNAVVATNGEQALVRAQAADDAIANGVTWGPLHGLPITIKDSFETEGLLTTCGTPEWAGHIPRTNADAVQALVDAGAIVTGKTNVAEYVADLQTFNPLFGTTNNPWDLTRSPGGSSGGSAAAIASGLSALELGSDLGGSLRLPASFTGIYAHKTSYGIVPHRGQLPPQPGDLAPTDMACIGPMARAPHDLSLALDILIAQDRTSPWRLRLPPPRHTELSQFRVGIWLDETVAPIDEEVLTAITNLARQLERDDVDVERIQAPPVAMAELFDLYWQLALPIFAATMSDDDFEALASDASSTAPEDTDSYRLAKHTTIRHRSWARANERRLQIQASFAELFRTIDVILCPASVVTAITHDRRPFGERQITINNAPYPYASLAIWGAAFNATYLPATAVPIAATTTGLPIGLQIVGPPLEDRTSLRFAELIEAYCGFHPTPDHNE